jgi:hypothetical protein
MQIYHLQYHDCSSVPLAAFQWPRLLRANCKCSVSSQPRGFPPNDSKYVFHATSLEQKHLLRKGRKPVQTTAYAQRLRSADYPAARGMQRFRDQQRFPKKETFPNDNDELRHSAE